MDGNILFEVHDLDQLFHTVGSHFNDILIDKQNLALNVRAMENLLDDWYVIGSIVN